MVVAIGLDESLLTNKKKNKNALDLLGWMELVDVESVYLPNKVDALDPTDSG